MLTIGLRWEKPVPEAELAKARDALAKEQEDVEAMWTIVKSPLAGDAEKTALMESFYRNAPEIIKNRGLFGEDVPWEKERERGCAIMLLGQYSSELEKRGLYKDAIEVYETAEKLMGSGTCSGDDYGMRYSHMHVCACSGNMESAKAICGRYREDPVLQLHMSSLCFRKGDVEEAKKYLDIYIEDSIFAEEFIEMMLDADCVEKIRDKNYSVPGNFGHIISWIQENESFFDQKDFFLWARAEIERETMERTGSSQYTKNFFAYEKDFLSSGDITAYYKWNGHPGLLRKGNKLYRAGLDGNVHYVMDAKDNSPVFAYVEGIPEKTYAAWCSRPPGRRAGYALIRYKGQWRIAIRAEADPHTDGYMRPCAYREECMKLHIEKMSKEKRFSDYIFLFSGTDKEQKWPPQKMRMWILLPESLYGDKNLFNTNMDLEHRFSSCGCMKNPEKCRHKKMLSGSLTVKEQTGEEGQHTGSHAYRSRKPEAMG